MQQIINSSNTNFKGFKAIFPYLLLVIVLLIYFCKLPAFFDSYGKLSSASYYLNNVNAHLALPNSLNDGHSPLFDLYLSGFLKLFGYNLVAAHFSVFPFVLLILVAFVRLLNYLEVKLSIYISLFVLFCEPAFATQIVYFGHELANVAMILLLLNAIIYQQNKSVVIFSTVLSLLNIRGFLLIPFFVLFDFMLYKQYKRILLFAPALILFLLWAFYNHSVNGWWFQNPERIIHRGFVSIAQMGKNLLVVFWKIFDSGRIVLIPFLVYAYFKFRFNQRFKVLFLAAVLLFSGITLSQIIFNNPISVKYFLSLIIVFILIALKAISIVKSKNACIVVVSIVLLSGHFWYYPNKYSNNWDTSLKSLGYFSLKDSCDSYMVKNGINTKNVYAGYQLNFDEGIYKMNSDTLKYQLIDDTQLHNYPYVLESNICNNYNANRLDQLKNYTLIKEFKAGYIYINLYQLKGNIRP